MNLGDAANIPFDVSIGVNVITVARLSVGDLFGRVEAVVRDEAMADARAMSAAFTDPDERRAFETLGLAPDADRMALRRSYSQLVRRYHPDRNGGDRSQETRLQSVVEAYNLLRASALFA